MLMTRIIVPNNPNSSLHQILVSPNIGGDHLRFSLQEGRPKGTQHGNIAPTTVREGGASPRDQHYLKNIDFTRFLQAFTTCMLYRK